MQALTASFQWLPDLYNPMAEKMACSKPHPITAALNESLKRKRNDSWSSIPSYGSSSPVKRHKLEIVQPSVTKLEGATKAPLDRTVDAVAPAPPVDESHELKESVQTPPVPDEIPVAKPAPSMHATVDAKIHAQEKIEAQINLEILLKHDELRLIDQEIAKCQIALEQLRRCHAIPYPAQSESQLAAEQVITGTGPALQPPPGFSRPEDPAPWGVTDGAYSRHYARWLLPDPLFDSNTFQESRHSASSTTTIAITGRSTRSADDLHPSYPRIRTGALGQAPVIAASQATPRDRNLPLLGRRTDGTLVRMVCQRCGKSDSANIQGFINHCRIQHGVSYKSHTEAADVDGIPCDDQSGTIVSTPAEPLPTATIQTPLRAGSTINPLVELPASAPEPKPSQSIFPGPPKGYKAPEEMEIDNPAFTPSAKVPRLSSLLEKRGIGKNLEFIVTGTKADLASAKEAIAIEAAAEAEEEKALATAQSTANTPIRNKPIAKPKSRRPGGSAGGAVSSGLRIKLPNLPMAHFPAEYDSATSSSSNATSARNSISFTQGTGHDNSSPASPSSSRFSIGSFLHGDIAGTPERESSRELSPSTVQTSPGLLSNHGDDLGKVYEHMELEDGQLVHKVIIPGGEIKSPPKKKRGRPRKNSVANGTFD